MKKAAYSTAFNWGKDLDLRRLGYEEDFNFAALFLTVYVSVVDGIDRASEAAMALSVQDHREAYMTAERLITFW